LATEFVWATEADFEDVARLGRLMHEESSYSKLEFNEDRLRHIFNIYTTDPTRALILGRVNGEACGLYAGYITPYYFSNELVANDIAWFVVKERRGSSLGLRLLTAFENWAKDQGVSEIRVGYSTDINPTAFDSLMIKRGYSRVGGNYRLERQK
jgi:GNAT superfamily N-acetyltransferase